MGRPTVCGRRRASAASFDGAVVDRALVRLDGATTLCPCSPRSLPSLIIGYASPRRRWSWEATGTKADEPVCGSRGRATDPPLYVCVADFNSVQEVHRDRELAVGDLHEPVPRGQGLHLAGRGGLVRLTVLHSVPAALPPFYCLCSQLLDLSLPSLIIGYASTRCMWSWEVIRTNAGSANGISAGSWVCRGWWGHAKR